MRIEITTCHSILAKCLENLNHFDLNSIGNKLLEEFFKRKFVLHRDLEEEYISYFTSQRPDLLDQFMTFFQTIVSQQDQVKIISTYKKTNCTKDNYYNILLGISNETQDKVLLSNISEETLEQGIKNFSICKLNTDRIINRADENILNDYRLPIVRKVINSDESSIKLSKWLSRFIKDEDNFHIVDNYIYENRQQFLNYFLNNVKLGTNIEIYTMINKGNTEANLISTFKRAPFNKWNFKINIVTRKKDQHARDILTDRYYIEIDKGMMVFGNNNKTHQANITITYRGEIKDKTLPRSRVAHA